MRPIKFRAWHKKLNMFVYFTVEDVYHGYVFNESREEHLKAHPLMEELEPEQQFTGLKDKNGKEIYEGDIVKDSKTTGVVRFGEYESTHVGMWGRLDIGLVGYYIETNKFPVSLSKVYCEGDKEDGIPGHKVIGNVYENPELLGEKR